MKVLHLALFVALAPAVAADPIHYAPKDNQYDVCTDFCKGALTVCEGTVDWVTGTHAVAYSRHEQKAPKGGIFGTNTLGKPHEQFDACHKTCMGWQYWRQPANIDFSERYFNGYAIGDNLNCRLNHLHFAQGIPNFYYGLQASESESAPQHCQHLTPDGGWVCTDYREPGKKTASQQYKDAAVLKRRLGDCWVTFDGRFADCHAKALRDETIDAALAWLPDDIEYIFLNNNALQRVPDISRFTELKGIWLENNSILQLDDANFSDNKKLEIINLGNNLIGFNTIPEDGMSFTPDYTFPETLLYDLENLKAFFITFNYITDIPSATFQNNKELEMLALVDNALVGFHPGTFDGLNNLQLLAFGQQGKGPLRGKLMTNAGIPDDLFDDLENVQYLSTFINGLTQVKARWFEKMNKVEAIAIFLNGVSSGGPPLVVEDGVFDNLPNLIDYSQYSSDLLATPATAAAQPLAPHDFAKNKKIQQVLDGTQFALAPQAFRSLVGMGDLDPLGIHPELLPLPRPTP